MAVGGSEECINCLFDVPILGFEVLYSDRILGACEKSKLLYCRLLGRCVRRHAGCIEAGLINEKYLGCEA